MASHVRPTAPRAPDTAPGAPTLLPPASSVTEPTVVRPPRRPRVTDDPVQEFYSIGEVCDLTELKPHVLRYWESQFRFLSPAKNRAGNRVYARKEVELVLLVKHLLYTEKFTIDGARQKLDAHRRAGALRTEARAVLATEVVESLERDLRDLMDLLEGRRSPSPQAPAEDDAPGATG